MIVLEMIGYYDFAFGSQNYFYLVMFWFYFDWGDFIVVVGRIQDINVVCQVKAVLLLFQDLFVYFMNILGFIFGIDFFDYLNYW